MIGKPKDSPPTIWKLVLDTEIPGFRIGSKSHVSRNSCVRKGQGREDPQDRETLLISASIVTNTSGRPPSRAFADQPRPRRHDPLDNL